MQERGLAAAWGLLAVLVAGTIAWLALTDERRPAPAAAPRVTVDIPPFPAAPAEEPEQAEVAESTQPPEDPAPTGSLSEAAESRQEPVSAEAIETARRHAAALAPADRESGTAGGSGAEMPAAGTRVPEIQEEIPEEIPVAEAPAGETPDNGTPGSPGSAPDEPRPDPAEAVQPVPPPAPDVAERPDTDEDATDAAPSEAPRSDGEAAEAPAGTGIDGPARPEAGAEAQSKPLPPTVEVGALRPIPDAALQPLQPPDAPQVDPALTEAGPFGPLPAVAPDGRRAWNAYARPFSAAPDKPRVAIVIGNLGLASGITESAINDLPPEVTLSFAPYADNVESWVAKARAAGHEVMLDLPMEPIDYPKHDPGPKALFTHLEPGQNIERLQWVLGRAVGYVGVTNFMGSRFTTSPDALRPVLEALRDRGLMFLDSRSAARSLATTMASEIELPRAVNDRFIDVKASRAAIDRRLSELEEIAAKEGTAVGIGYPYPVTIDRVARWARELEARGKVELAPISAVAGRQADR